MKNLLVALLALPIFVFSQTEETKFNFKKKLKKYSNSQLFMVLLMEELQYLMMIYILSQQVN